MAQAHALLGRKQVSLCRNPAYWSDHYWQPRISSRQRHGIACNASHPFDCGSRRSSSL